MSTKIPTSLTIPLEKKGLTFRFVTKATGKKREQVCEIRTRDTGQLILSESGSTDEAALRKAAQACESVARPLRDDEARRKLAEQEREIRDLQAKLEAAAPPAAASEPAPFATPPDDSAKRGRRPKPSEDCTTC